MFGREPACKPSPEYHFNAHARLGKIPLLNQLNDAKIKYGHKVSSIEFGQWLRKVGEGPKLS